MMFMRFLIPSRPTNVNLRYFSNVRRSPYRNGCAWCFKHIFSKMYLQTEALQWKQFTIHFTNIEAFLNAVIHSLSELAFKREAMPSILFIYCFYLGSNAPFTWQTLEGFENAHEAEALNKIKETWGKNLKNTKRFNSNEKKLLKCFVS